MTFISARGLWSVDYLTDCYLVRGGIIKNIKLYYQSDYAEQMAGINTSDARYDYDSYFGYLTMENCVDMFVTNREDFGYLIDVP